jgi:two-component system OmpR family response regulator
LATPELGPVFVVKPLQWCVPGSVSRVREEPMKAPRILIVDDDDAVRSLLATALRSEGYAVITATNGRHALIEIAWATCDVILTDLRMPVMDGDELVRILHNRGDRTPIIAMTGVSNQRPAEDGITCLRKPFDVETVLALVEKAIHPN